MGLSVSVNNPNTTLSPRQAQADPTQEAEVCVCIKCKDTFIESRERFAVQSRLQAGGGNGEPRWDGEAGCRESQRDVS